MQLYDILYLFYEGPEQREAALDALMKKMRSSMTGNYLASEESVKRVLGSCTQLMEFVTAHSMEKKTQEVRMVCRSVLSRCQRNFSALPEFQRLQALVQNTPTATATATARDASAGKA